MAEFVHLHNHTEYSLLDGMIRIAGKEPSAFLKNLPKNNIKAMAVTDHGNMFGAMEFYKNAKEVGIKPIIGCEFYTTPDKYNVIDKNKTHLNHLTVLAADLRGYNNLIKLNSAAWVDGFYYKPRIDFDLLSKHKEGLIVLSGCLKGELAQAALRADFEEAGKIAARFKDLLGAGNYYIEIMDHGIPDEQTALKNLLEIAKQTGIPLVATNDCHYETRADWQAHDIHMCIEMGKTLEDPKRLKMTTHELYFKTPDEMAKLFDYAPQALKNTLEITEKCGLEFKKSGFILPRFEIPAAFASPEDFLKEQCLKGLKKKLKTDAIPPEYMKRLEDELAVIGNMGFASYFLIVQDFIAYARSRDIPVGPGRGSGAGALVAYSTDITRIDPIKNGLLFERFLNPDRISMPDLDIDFSDVGREQVIEYMRQKYGRKNITQIITFGAMKAKLALKDVARVMEFSVADSNRLGKLIPNTLDATIAGATEQVPEIKTEIAKDPKVKQLFEFAAKIEGLKRHTGVHAAGVLVTPQEATEYVPLAKGRDENSVTTQFEGKTLEEMGLLKIDFLGLRTLTVISEAVKLIKKLRGIDIDIDNIPLDDKKTYELLAAARTNCVFQLESGGMKDLVKRMRPEVFGDISALVALYRPGPMQSGMMDSFVNRKSGREKISYDHPLLEPILKETYGTMVYQEQIMEISKSLAGFTPGEADFLRKAMGKKTPQEMEKFRSKFIAGAAKNGLSARAAEKLFNQMAEFAGYGFNKSHSFAYALVSYQTAYLKSNYPIEFMCSALTNEIGHNAIGSADKENKIATYLEESRKMGYDILPPDIQNSMETFSVEKLPDGKEAIRFGLTAIKNVGEEACKNMVAERAGSGKFKDLHDFCRRINLQQANKRTLESLALAGAFDGFYAGNPPEQARAQAMADIEPAAEQASLIKEEKAAAADSLFGDALSQITLRPKTGLLKKARPFTKAELLNHEKEIIGLYLSGHPLAKYARHLGKLVKADIAALQENIVPGAVEVAGIISRIKKRQTRNKDNWAQLAVEDQTQTITANAFSRAWAQLSGRVEVNQAVIVYGDVRGDELSAKAEIMVSNIEPILNVISRKARRFIVRLPENVKEEHLRRLNVLMDMAKGTTEVYLTSPEPGGKTAAVKTSKKIVIHTALVDFIEENFGPDPWDFD
ncbi:MAG: DNA polymerase III subunit alpha [Elusimicrobiota bacterium]|jgi:DNA polymerase-3 subunit alpha|nr:DNA polymerase III subunit alpha [Elusimicrobiota bacterium]